MIISFVNQLLFIFFYQDEEIPYFLENLYRSSHILIQNRFLALMREHSCETEAKNKQVRIDERTIAEEKDSCDDPKSNPQKYRK